MSFFLIRIFLPKLYYFTNMMNLPILIAKCSKLNRKTTCKFETVARKTSSTLTDNCIIRKITRRNLLLFYTQIHIARIHSAYLYIFDSGRCTKPIHSTQIDKLAAFLLYTIFVCKHYRNIVLRFDFNKSSFR